jgi:signal peptidase I
LTDATAPRARLREWAKSIVFALAAWLLLRTFVVQAFHITSGSMESTLLVGDVLFVARPLYGAEVPFTHAHLPAIREPVHGDLVVFEGVETPGLEIIKRVIGLPGDTLAMHGGAVWRNGRVLEEPYASHSRPGEPDAPGMEAKMRDWQEHRLIGVPPAAYHPDRNNWGPLVVPVDSLFVMGDNRDDSWDGRFWGFLPRSHLHGRALLIYYSFDPASWRLFPLLTAVRWDRLFTVPK